MIAYAEQQQRLQNAWLALPCGTPERACAWLAVQAHAQAHHRPVWACWPDELDVYQAESGASHAPDAHGMWWLS